MKITQHAVLPSSTKVTENALRDEAEHWVVSELLMTVFYDTFKDDKVLDWISSMDVSFVHKKYNYGPPLCENYIGRTALNGCVVTEDITDAAQITVNDIWNCFREHDVTCRLLIEQHIAAYFPTLDLLYIWDYVGRHEVPAKNSAYLTDYVAGLINHFKIRKSDMSITQVRLRIVQSLKIMAGEI